MLRSEFIDSGREDRLGCIRWLVRSNILELSICFAIAVCTAISTFAAPTLSIPQDSGFTPPSPNACQSDYDQFYIAEPGVYAYWALCEAGSNPGIFDYAGRFDLSPESNAWSSGPGTIHGGVPGPVPDGETATQVTTASSFIANQDIPMNTQQGTLATWVNTDSTNYPVTMIYLAPVIGHGKSLVSIQASMSSNSECFTGTFGNAYGSSFTTPAVCGHAPYVWHRIVFTWSNGTLTLYVDGIRVSTYWYGGALDNTVFVYRLFPESGNTGKQTTLAKALIANQAWSVAQVEADYKPTITLPPIGGVYVTNQRLGVVHRDVLGYADFNADLSTSPLVSALATGLSSMGVTA
ncbi:MAG: Concanavalin A-like lectin/glucanase superfamily, partial [Acidobacteriaceae bacterium]|nr:Concanavalin A-like lectin/glucanase superfamily [Acidobacteriaceae bacterium]